MLPTARPTPSPGQGPNLVSLDPANFASNLPAGERELTATFDRPMNSATWSWIQESPGTAPQVIVEPSFAADGRKATVKVKLEAAHNYVVWLNDLEKAGFQDTSGHPLPPLRWVFSTVGAPGSSAAAASQPGAQDALVLPRVVSTSPQNGAIDVDPKLDKLTVMFDRPMDREGWSWVKETDANFPETAGEPSFDAQRKTNTLPVRLKPATTYTVWCNSDQFKMFTDDQGRPAVPFRWTFTTRK